MPNFTLTFPDGFEEYEWLLPSKGWFPGARLTVAGRTYSLTFYDKERLHQTIEEDVSARSVFFETNLVILESVTRYNMLRAAEYLIRSDQLSLLAPEIMDA